MDTLLDWHVEHEPIANPALILSRSPHMYFDQFGAVGVCCELVPDQEYAVVNTDIGTVLLEDLRVIQLNIGTRAEAPPVGSGKARKVGCTIQGGPERQILRIGNGFGAHNLVEAIKTMLRQAELKEEVNPTFKVIKLRCPRDLPHGQRSTGKHLNV